MHSSIDANFYPQMSGHTAREALETKPMDKKMTDNDKKRQANSPFQAYVINERGEEVPITDSMVEESMREVKLQSIGAHTGYTKAITDELIKAQLSKKD